FAAAEGGTSVVRRRRLVRAALAAAFAVAAGAVWLGPWRGAGTAPPAESTLIVVPFAPVVPDTALARLGRELVITLATNLDGAGGLRVVEPITVLGQAEARAGGRLEPADAAELARRLGAGRVIHGRLSHAGAGVRIDATVFAADDLAVLSRASAEAPI